MYGGTTLSASNSVGPGGCQQRQRHGVWFVFGVFGCYTHVLAGVQRRPIFLWCFET